MGISMNAIRENVQYYEDGLISELEALHAIIFIANQRAAVISAGYERCYNRIKDYTNSAETLDND